MDPIPVDFGTNQDSGIITSAYARINNIPNALNKYAPSRITFDNPNDENNYFEINLIPNELVEEGTLNVNIKPIQPTYNGPVKVNVSFQYNYQEVTYPLWIEITNK